MPRVSRGPAHVLLLDVYLKILDRTPFIWHGATGCADDEYGVRKLFFRTTAAAVILATSAQADCPAGQDVFASCQVADRGTQVSACFDYERATYSYGPVGGPAELVISETIAGLDFEPWSGVTRATGESVTFYNGAYSYTLVGGFERLPPSDDALDENGDPDALTRHYGWVDVARNGKTLAHLECIPETVSYAFGGGIYDLKIAIGQTWDGQARQWTQVRR